ncbi:MAG: AraC family transcriptional regulator [Maribacter sp.]|uniref:helix-turn-helix domain-containing protein n=1 Tax=Maribacter sp. TaxID=1897614 RepID=UPI00329A7203
MNFNIFNTLILSGILQGFIFFVAVISNKKYKSKANSFLALTVLFLSISNLNYYAWDVGLMKEIPGLTFLHIPWALTLAPSFYLYVRHSVKGAMIESQKPKNTLALFTPFILISLCIWGTRLYTFLLETPDIIKNNFYFYLELVNLVAIVGSALASYRLLNKFRAAKKKMPERFFLKLGWLRKMLVISCAIIVCWVVLIVLDMATAIDSITLFYPLWLSLTIWIYWVGYTGIYQSKLAQERAEIRRELKNKQLLAKASTFQKNSTREAEHFNQIIQLLKNDQIYTNPSLGLQDIGDRLNISPNYVSKIVNAQANISFTDLVNQYRHEMIKEMLQDSNFSNYKIMAIALEAGFNSKSNFYKYFKSVEGVTPTEYRKKLLELS